MSEKRTVLKRYTEARSAKDWNEDAHKVFCGTILSEQLENAKDAISRVGKLWNKDYTETDANGNVILREPMFMRSDTAFDHVEKELTAHVKKVMAALRGGATKVKVDLPIAPF